VVSAIPYYLLGDPTRELPLLSCCVSISGDSSSLET
jgi:hypothetical protein